ncbi:MAG: LLM class F420-dependent oxidoreductase [Haliea sp.]|nr:LLM class F420-dependent oxidoreductase [Haliea sp.]
MQLGVAYPCREVDANPQSVRKFIRAAEALGYTHLMAYDHVVMTPHENREPRLNGPYTEQDAFYDPFVFFGFAAAVSETLEFVSGVVCLPQRQTALVARQAADVDLLSSERLRLGVGIGWNHVEFEALGCDFRTRGKRIDEQIELLRQLWTGEVLDFRGEYDRIDRGCINPAPSRQIPLWLGGHTEPGFKRGARLGDGFIFAATGEGAVAGWERVKFHLAAYGRDADDFGAELLTLFARDAQESVDHLRRFRDAGGQYGCFHSLDKGLGNSVDAHIDFIAETRRIWDTG